MMGTKERPGSKERTPTKEKNKERMGTKESMGTKQRTCHNNSRTNQHIRINRFSDVKNNIKDVKVVKRFSCFD